MKTIRSAILEKSELRLVEMGKQIVGLVFSPEGKPLLKIEGTIADEVWQQLHDQFGMSNPKYFGYDGAIARFLKFYKSGFESKNFICDERDYKVSAKEKLDSTVPLEAALSGKGHGEAVLSAFRSTNLLYPVEKTRLQELLRGKSADDFITAAAQLCVGDTRPALNRLDELLRPFDNAKWTVVTYLPFLWKPHQHMFLKPEVTKDFAVRVGHSFSGIYEAKLNADVYESLLSMVVRTRAELSELNPRDNIDIQSFIWVIGAYKEGSEPQKL